MHYPETLRLYGESGHRVIVLHGGPGAPGTMAPVARELAANFRVIEPFQRRSGAVPLTVARHIADLSDIAETVVEGDGRPPAILGSSWGAMLALAFAAEEPALCGPVALIGCGTFDPPSRKEYEARRKARLTEQLGDKLRGLAEALDDPDERLSAIGHALTEAYSHRVITDEIELERCDARGHQETWNDMLRLQANGTYPQRFERIKSPVLMLHGEDDPHPGRLIRDSLLQYIPELEYHEWDRCGHYPWLERYAQEEFYARLQAWLHERFTFSAEV